MYSSFNEKFQSAAWVEFPGEIKGTAKSGAGGTQFWPGTKYVQVVILALPPGGKIYFDDLKLEEQK